MQLYILLIPFIIAIILSAVFVPYIMLITYKKRLFDPIDVRKLHHQITPRLGGVAFAPIQCVLFVLTFVVIYKTDILGIDLGVKSYVLLPHFMMLICGLMILFIVGIADDLVGVSYRWKFIIQAIVASFLPLSGVWINNLYGVFFVVDVPLLIGFPLTVFAVVLIINAVNLMDGIDGLCSGVIMSGCFVLGCLFSYYGAWLHALFAFLTLGVLIPFFYYNVYGTRRRKRKIFMGDTGSMTLGYSISFLAISFAMHNKDISAFFEGAIVVAFSMLIVPVLDVARVMWVRYRAGKPVFKPDRNHFHHKLLRLGFTQRQSMLTIVGLVFFFCILNIILVNTISNNIALVINILVWVLIQFVLNKFFSVKKHI